MSVLLAVAVIVGAVLAANSKTVFQAIVLGVAPCRGLHPCPPHRLCDCIPPPGLHSDNCRCGFAGALDGGSGLGDRDKLQPCVPSGHLVSMYHWLYSCCVSTCCPIHRRHRLSGELSVAYCWPGSILGDLTALHLSSSQLRKIKIFFLKGPWGPLALVLQLWLQVNRS